MSGAATRAPRPGAARRLLRTAQHLVPRGRPGATVLAYHLVGAGTGGAVDLDADVFRRQLDELAERGRVVPLAKIGDPATGGEGPVALTFDDAYANFFERAWPLLAERGLPATLFVPVGFVEGTHPAPIAGTDHLPPASWADLAVAAGEGLEIGCHSWTHRDLRRVRASELAHELAGARRRLEDRLGAEVASFCYPRALWDRRVEQAVAREYRRAVIGGGRRWAPSRSPWRIQRVSLRRDGPASLTPVLAAGVWLEEWVADRARRLRPSGGPRA